MQRLTRHNFVWGWLRLALGLTQMSFATAGASAMITLGRHWFTYAAIAIATAATITSRLTYHGKTAP